MTGFYLRDGAGNCYGAKVSSTNRLEVNSVTRSRQHSASLDKGYSYQVFGEVSVISGTATPLFMRNTSNSLKMVITYIRLGTIGVDSDSENAYWETYLGGTYSSGGTSVTAVNAVSGNTTLPEADFYSGNNIVFTNNGSLLDKNYRSNIEITYNKEGSIILPKSQTMSFLYTGTSANGKAYARCSFYLTSE